VGIFVLVFRNRALRHRQGDIPVRVLRPGKSRWVRGHAVWVSDVFAWRGSPAAWNESLELISRASEHDATAEELSALHRMGEHVVVATLTTADDLVFHAATTADHRAALMGPFASTPERT
jgi:hypothetical protein